jgi:nicotinic acid mononucleotide adenylyltransferase
MSALPISSTMVRNRIKNKQPINGLVPEGVLEYIKENDLYV